MASRSNLFGAVLGYNRMREALADAGGVGGVIAGADRAIRQQAAERAAVAENARQYGIVQDLRSKMGAEEPDLGGVEAKIRNYLGGDEGAYLKQLQSKARGADAVRESIYQSAAMNSRPGVVQMLNERLAGDSKMDRAVQVGTYGAIGGGITMGLTAAGQGLMALMDYIQGGEEQNEARDRPLV